MFMMLSSVSEPIKKGYTHERAIEMILSGECGIFNPILIECFMEIEPKIKQKYAELWTKIKAE